MLLGKRSKLSLSGTLMDNYITKFRARANVFLLYSESFNAQGLNLFSSHWAAFHC